MEKDIVHVMQFFSYEHLPPELQEVSRPFCELAWALTTKGVTLAAVGPVVSTLEALPDNRERDKALGIFKTILMIDPIIDQLDRLLMAKDAAVRARVAK